MEKVNLAQFGVDKIGYKDLKSAMRFFGKGFNEFFGLVEENQTATVSEILVYALNVASKGGKGNKITEWLDKAKLEKGLVVTNEENEVVDKVALKIEEIKERQKAELINLVAKEVFELESTEIDKAIPRGVDIVNLDEVSSTDITKKKEVKVKNTTTTKKEVTVQKDKLSVIEDFERKMSENAK